MVGWVALVCPLHHLPRILQGVLIQTLLEHLVGVNSFRCLGEVNVKVAGLLFQERYRILGATGGWQQGGWEMESDILGE